MHAKCLALHLNTAISLLGILNVFKCAGYLYSKLCQYKKIGPANYPNLLGLGNAEMLRKITK